MLAMPPKPKPKAKAKKSKPKPEPKAKPELLDSWKDAEAKEIHDKAFKKYLSRRLVTEPSYFPKRKSEPNKKVNWNDSVEDHIERSHPELKLTLGRAPMLLKDYPAFIPGHKTVKPEQREPAPPAMHTGGIVPTTKVYKLQKGEMVVPKARVKAVKKAMAEAHLKPIK